MLMVFKVSSHPSLMTTSLELLLYLYISTPPEQVLCIQVKETEVTMPNFFIAGLFVLATIAGVAMVDGAGECGKVPADRMALRLAPCASASQDPQAAVSAGCCSEVQKLSQTPSCLCAVMLSNTAKIAGVKPEIAVTIPKRCSLADRPVGYKCGAYTVP